MSSLEANNIVESMYSQCDADRNEHLLLDVLVDYFMDIRAISLTEQQTSVQGKPVTSKPTAGWKICS